MQTSDKIDIQSYFDIFHKYKWHGLIPGCFVMVALIILSFFLPKIYESTCKVEVDRGTIENPLKTQREHPQSLNDHLLVFSENAFKWDVLARVIDEVGPDVIVRNSDIYNLGKLKRRLGLGKDKNSGSEEEYSQREAVIRLLKSEVKFKQREPRFLLLTYRGVDANVNAKILNTLVSILIEEKTRSELNHAGRNYAFLKAELESYRQKLEEAEVRLKEFKEQHISELPSNMNLNLTQLANDNSQLLSCQLELKELTARINYIDEELAKSKELIVSEVKRETHPMLMVLNERIVDMEIELTKLGTNYTDLHPRVLELRGQLEDLKKQRDALQRSTVDTETSMLNPVYQQLVQDKQEALIRIEVLKNRTANLKNRIQDSEEKVRTMPEQEQQLLTLTRNYEVTARIHDMFLQELEEVKVQEKLATEEKDKESFRVLEYARATFAPVGPNRLRLLLTIAMIGMGTCVGVMALLNFLDDSFKNVEEAKEFLKKPLLGTVPSLGNEGSNGRLSAQIKFLKGIGKTWTGS